MGSFDRRKSWKMRQRRAQAAKKQRDKRSKSTTAQPAAGQGEKG